MTMDDDATLPPTPLEHLTDGDTTLPPTSLERLGVREPPPPPAPRRTGRLLMILGAVALAAVVLLDALSTPAALSAAMPSPQDPATSGVWYCPATAQEGSAILSIAATGAAPSSIAVVRHAPDGPIVRQEGQVEPGEQREIVLDETQSAQPVSVRWSGGPSVATWRTESADAAAGLPCSPGPSPTWYLSGMDTANGNAALYLFNPFTVDAVADITFPTPEGSLTLARTASRLVEAGTSQRIDLITLVPEVADLGVIVEVGSGRLIAAGESSYAPVLAQPGPEGRALVPAAEVPSTTWAFAFSDTGGDSESWLSVANPGDRDAALQVNVSAPNAESDLFPPTEHVVPAGGTLRIPLEEASTEAEFGIVATVVNDVPVVVTRTTSMVRDGKRGIAASLGAAPSPTWALAGGGEAGRAAQLSVYNPGAAPVNVSIDAGEGTPAEWEAVQVDANERAFFELNDVGDRPGIPVLVQADGPVVAEQRVLGDADPNVNRLPLWTGVGVPELRWRGPATRPTVRRDPALDTTPLGQPVEEPS